jgi:hypothetical protein
VVAEKTTVLSESSNGVDVGSLYPFVCLNVMMVWTLTARSVIQVVPRVCPSDLLLLSL